MNQVQIEFWNGESGHIWVAEQVRLDKQLGSLGRAAMASLGPRPGERILDVGCGAGQSTRELGEAVGPSGRVLGLDVSKPLIATALQVDHPAQVDFALADAQTHAFSGDFDAMFSRFGVMFFSDPIAAFMNLHRALGPGGRLAFVCWRAFAENPIMSVPLDAAAPHLPALPQPPDPEAPGPFAFADSARVKKIVEAGGFREVVLTPHDERIGGNDLEGSLDLALKLGPLGRILRENPGHRERVVNAVRDALAPFMVDGVAQFPSATWIVTAAA